MNSQIRVISQQGAGIGSRLLAEHRINQKTATGKPVAVSDSACRDICGAPSTTRTCDLLDRNQTLYPSELWALSCVLSKLLMQTLAQFSGLEAEPESTRSSPAPRVDLEARVNGGESGIRTHGTFDSTQAFQACALSRSAISP